MIKIDYTLMNKLEKYKEKALRASIYDKNNVKKYKRCPYCGSIYFIKFGRYYGIQRYRCKNCKKTFSNTTCSVWKYLKINPEKWINFIEYISNGTSLKECAYKLKISTATAFYWRHKILHAVENYYKPNIFTKSIVIRQHNVPKCYKGSRNKHFTDKESASRRISAFYAMVPRDIQVLISSEKEIPQIDVKYKDDTLENIFKYSISTKIQKGCYIHLDKIRNYIIQKEAIQNNKKLSKEIKKKYEFTICKNLIGALYIKDKYKIQSNIENYVNRLYGWIHNFRGIASKYISHYYSFYSLINCSIKFDQIRIFKELLKNGNYTSIREMKLNHLENY
ncbi:transposase [Clostridium sp. BJN0001]|uniref:IS1/IS1595 family N-terminal zinc-binding domain-containing protein n=1 Tax=Clostridium sp. BJN0001 TaxID=2930219 RepID=UPI001FD3DD32|nr:transposase [Clostridium sp. BJN0001]